MDPDARPLVIMMPLVVATAVRARGFATSRVKSMKDDISGTEILLLAVIDGVAAAGMLEAAVVVDKWYSIVLCVVGAVLPAIAAGVNVWFDSAWAKYSITTGGLAGFVLSAVGASVAVFHKLDDNHRQQAANAYASLLPSLMLLAGSRIFRRGQ